MKKILSLALTLAAAAAVHAQGTFYPATYASDPNFNGSAGVVTDASVNARCFGSGYQAQYYIGAAGISGSAAFGNTVINGLSAVGPQAGFLGSTATDFAGGAGYFEGNNNNAISTTFAGGSTVSLCLYAWKGNSSSTLANATVAGHSAVYQFVLGGAGSPAGPANSWSQSLGGGNFEPTFANFSIGAAPEPATIALGLMGVGALFIRRRK